MIEKPGEKKKQRRKPIKSAKGKTCVKCGANDMVVAAHYSGYRKFQYGFGRGLKVNDLVTAYLCHKCHSEMDGVRGQGDIAHSEEFLHYVILSRLEDQ